MQKTPGIVSIRLVAVTRADLDKLIAEFKYIYGERLEGFELPTRPGREGDWLAYGNIKLATQQQFHVD
jgi:hypothetical protein